MNILLEKTCPMQFECSFINTNEREIIASFSVCPTAAPSFLLVHSSINSKNLANMSLFCPKTATKPKVQIGPMNADKLCPISANRSRNCLQMLACQHKLELINMLVRNKHLHTNLLSIANLCDNMLAIEEPHIELWIFHADLISKICFCK